jgi:hypothetical protein
VYNKFVCGPFQKVGIEPVEVVEVDEKNMSPKAYNQGYDASALPSTSEETYEATHESVQGVGDGVEEDAGESSIGVTADGVEKKNKEESGEKPLVVEGPTEVGEPSSTDQAVEDGSIESAPPEVAPEAAGVAV